MPREHDLDAHLQLRTDDDLVTGTLFIGPEAPSSEITPHVLAVFLDSKGIAERALDRAALKKLAADAQATSGVEVSAIVARGRPPRHGQPRKLEWTAQINERIDEIEARSSEDTDPHQPSSDASPEECADQQAVDHYGHSAFIIVNGGDELGTISPPDPGEDGEDIFGGVIPAKQSPNPSYIDSESIDLTEDNRVNARNSGHLVYSGSLRSVAATLEVPGDVGFATGNIDFPGPVNVGGGVKDLFRIDATGDVTVRRLVEAASISSDRDVIVERGVAGRDTGQIRSGRDVRAGYVESATINAGRDCIVQREITNCQIVARGSILIESGAVRGGAMTAGKRIEVGVLGSAQEVPSEILTGSIPELDQPLARIRVLRERADTKRSDLAFKLESLRSAMDTSNPDAIEKTMALDFDISEISTRITRLDEAAERIRVNLRKHADAQLSVQKRIHPGVRILFRNCAVRFEEEFDGPFTLKLDREGEPVIDQHGNERPAREVAVVEPDDTLDYLGGPDSTHSVHSEQPRESLGNGLVSDEGQQAA